MIPLLAGKQALADGVLDGRGDLSAMPLPSGRKALIQRLETLMARSAAPAPAEPVSPSLQTAQAAPEERTAADRLAALGIDSAAFDAVQRLIEAGVLQLTAEGRRLLTPAAAPDEDAEQRARLARARETFDLAERKMRMATVLAGGGFPVEALPALRDGVETALRSWAQLAGAEIPQTGQGPIEWIEKRLPQHLPLIGALGGTPVAVLGAGEEEARQWIAAGGRLAGELREELER
jgi:hypothetical protein